MFKKMELFKSKKETNSYVLIKDNKVYPVEDEALMDMLETEDESVILDYIRNEYQNIALDNMDKQQLAQLIDLLMRASDETAAKRKRLDAYELEYKASINYGRVLRDQLIEKISKY